MSRTRQKQSTWNPYLALYTCSHLRRGKNKTRIFPFIRYLICPIMRLQCELQAITPRATLANVATLAYTSSRRC
jgi:hypothetical protein